MMLLEAAGHSGYKAFHTSFDTPINPEASIVPHLAESRIQSMTLSKHTSLLKLFDELLLHAHVD